MGHLNQRGWINVATLVVYVPLLAGTLATLFRQRFRMKSFYYLLVFILVKFVGAAMTIDVQLKDNASLYTPAAILSTIVLTPLVMTVAGIINLQSASSPHFTPPQQAYALLPRSAAAAAPTEKRTFSSRSSRLTRLAHLLILASLALGIVGGLDVFSTAPDPDTPGKTYMRAAAGLAAGALLLIAAVVATNWGDARAFAGWSASLYVAVAVAVLPLLAARVAYTVGVAATVLTTRTQVFNPLTGSWVLYLCLAWLPEVLIGYVIVIMGLVKPRVR
ncbi:hypothetical protein SLS56_009128 [Neofusicoccum ribis]|uniref:DUF7702 domain-containing protein n=1 Tax=Neofusicoccum ribis TaxID=45134 RepID=A0ABR3SI87_9PEZI